MYPNINNKAPKLQPPPSVMCSGRHFCHGSQRGKTTQDPETTSWSLAGREGCLPKIRGTGSAQAQPLQGSPLTPTQQMTRGTHSTAQSIRRANSPSSDSVQGWAAHMVFPGRNSLGSGRVGGQVLQSFPHGTGSFFAIRKGVCKAHRTGRT